MKFLNKFLNTDVKRVVFACLLQIVMGGAMLVVPALWLGQFSLALLLGIAGFVASTVATGWYLAGIITDKVNLENVLLMMMLICALDLVVAMGVIAILLVVNTVIWALVVIF